MGCEKALGERTHGEEGQDCCKGPSLTVRNPVHSQGYRGDCDGGGRAAMRAPLSIVVGPPPPGDSIRVQCRTVQRFAVQALMVVDRRPLPCQEPERR